MGGATNLKVGLLP